MKPFVKWAGGKTKLLNEIEQRLPADFDEWEDVAYVEPFVGGGAVFYHMLQKHNNITKVIINDINDVLIGTYRAIKVNPKPLISGLKELENEYKSLDTYHRELKYYELRSLFNACKEFNTYKIILFLFLN